MDQCSRRYKTILNADVPEAIEAISKGVPKFGEDGVIDAGVEAYVCEKEFKGKSPLTSLTKSMQKISNVTRAIVRLLLWFYFMLCLYTYKHGLYVFDEILSSSKK